jgi:Predicted transcriptional regulators
MDKLILGLLLLKGRTIYELRDRIAEGMEMMYSASIGSIQAAIKKLLAAGYIVCEERVENGKFKKVYSITEAGRASFGDWVNSPIEASQGKNPELLKIYFMGLSDKEGRAGRIASHIANCKAKLAEIRLIVDEAQTMLQSGGFPPEATDILRYQMMSAQFGADLMNFQVQWFSGLLNQIKEGKM